MAKSDQKLNRVAIYCRTAVRDNHTQVSKGISSQLLALKKYAAKRHMKVVGVFIDDGYSGLSLDRPELNKLRKTVKKGSISMLLVYDLDRLSRDTLQSTQLLEEFETKGVQVLLLSDKRPEMKLIMYVSKVFREYEGLKRGEAIKRGLRHRKVVQEEERHEQR